jgi:predicted SAM-dependent methyltransferase
LRAGLIHRAYSFVSPLIDVRRFASGLLNYPRYIMNMMEFKRKSGASQPRYPVRLMPALHERTLQANFDPHYSYLSYWATKAVLAHDGRGDTAHIDVGGQIQWLMGLAASTRVTTIDIRPFAQDLPSLTVEQGDLAKLPFADQSVASLSCLHVVEHVGLGRYGDPVDPDGCWKAMAELARILAPGGRLFFAVPCGQATVWYNAHRVFHPQHIVNSFEEAGLVLQSLAGVTDDRHFHASLASDVLARQTYGCGFFEFKRDR